MSNSKSEDTIINEPFDIDQLKRVDKYVIEPPQDTSLDLRKAICSVFGVFPEELEYNLPGGIGLEKCKKLEALFAQQRAKLFEQIRSEVNSMSELSITDLELRQHQQGVEIPVLGKTELLEALTRLEGTDE